MKKITMNPKHIFKPFAAFLMIVSMSAMTLTVFAQDNDTTEVSQVSIKQVTQSSAIIDWKTNTPTTSVVLYNQSNILARLAPAQTDQLTNYIRDHSVSLSNLEPDSVYRFTLSGNKEGGDTVISQEYSFKTLASNTADEYPLITSYQLNNIGTSNARVSVITNTPTTLRLTYTKNTSNRDYLVQTGGMNTSHDITLNQLDPNTRYDLKLEVTNNQNHTTTHSGLFFITDEDETGKEPAVTNARIVAVTKSTAKLAWDTTVPTTTRAWYYSLNIGFLNYLRFGQKSQEFDQNLTTHHEITLEDLAASTSYKVKVGGNDATGKQLQSEEITFKTDNEVIPVPNDTVAPIIYDVDIANVSANSSRRSIRVNFFTDELATVSIMYSKSPDFTNSNTATSGNGKISTKNHTVRLTNMDRKSFYYFKITAKDQSGNTSTDTGVVYAR